MKRDMIITPLEAFVFHHYLNSLTSIIQTWRLCEILRCKQYRHR